MAQPVEICGKFEQGELLKGKAESSFKLVLNGKEFKVSDTGEFLGAIPRDEQEKAILEVFYHNNKSEKFDLTIKKHQWDIQSIKGVAQNKVTPPKQDEMEILREQKDVQRTQSLHG